MKNSQENDQIFRFDGQFPRREVIETLVHYRKNMRPDIYEEYGGLLAE